MKAVRIGENEIGFDDYLELNQDCTGYYHNRVVMGASLLNIHYAEKLRKGGEDIAVAVQ